MKTNLLACLCLALFSFCSVEVLRAETGELIAVFVEPSGCAIETMGGYRIAVGSANDSKIEIGELCDLKTSKFQPAHVLNYDPEKENNHWTLNRPVSYTHLTLPTILLV